MSHKFSTALRNIRLHVLRRDKTGADADFVGFASLQGVDPASPKGYGRTGPASPANLHKTRASTRFPFAYCLSKLLIDAARSPQDEDSPQRHC